MQNEMIDQLNKFSKDALASMKELAEINTRAAEKLMAKQTEIVSSALETSVNQVKALSSAKDYKAFFSTQADVTKENSEMLLSFGKEISKIMEEAKDELTKWVEESVAKAEGAVSTATKAAAAATSVKKAA